MRALAAAVALLAAGVPFGSPQPASAQAVETVRYGEADGVSLLMDVYRPPDQDANGIGVLVIHGGRWMDGDRGDTPADLVASQGFVAFSPDYRLAPEFTYPAAIEDLQMAVRYIREHAGEFDIDPTKIWAFGASAGGHLAALLAALGQGSTTEDARVAAAVSWSGPMDLELLSRTSRGLERAATQFVGCGGRFDTDCPESLREASPVSHLDPTDPPLFIANSTDEPIPFDQAIAGAQAADAAGVERVLWPLEGTLHGFSYVREILPPTISFVLNELEGQENPLTPPSVAVPSPTASPDESVPQGSNRETAPEPRSRRGSPWGLALGLLLVVAGAVLGTVLVLRNRNVRSPW